MRLIDADALAKKMQLLIRTHCRDAFDALNAIDNAPTIDPESFRPQGKWVDNHCTACGMTPLGEELWEHLDGKPPRFELCMDYCPCCGAEMKGGADND